LVLFKSKDLVMATMKVIIKKERAKGLTLSEAPIPEFGPDEVLIKIKKTAICGTDVHIYNWDEWSQKTIPVPLIVGHEYFGIIEDVGSNVKQFKKGDRVSGEGHIVCDVCRNCRAGRRHLCNHSVGVGVDRQGAFAEFLVIPAGNAFHIPNNISDDMASIFDPYGNATHTALSFDLVGEDVLITGAGPIGCMAAGIARHAGARQVVITDVNDYRLELAKKLGATRVVRADKEKLKDVMKEVGMIEGFDVGFEMSGNQFAFNDMLETMNNGGRISLLGIFSDNVSIDWSHVVFKGLTIKGIYGREMYETWYKMASMLQSGLDISPVITHQLNVDDFEEGFKLLNDGKAGKVILNWN
jgi:threonine 3-dehydrogenase